jgi:hypothetical protein
MTSLPRRALVVPAALVVLMVAIGFLLWNSERRESLEAATRHLISQIDQATESYRTDYAMYPPVDFSNLLKSITRESRRRHETTGGEPSECLSSPLGKPIYYLCPGIHQPARFDLWTEDARGNPTGINNW